MSDSLREEMLEKAGRGELFGAIFLEYGKMHFKAGDPVIETLASLHNDGLVDLLGLVTAPALEPIERFAFFKGQHLYRALIPHLETSAEELIRAIHHLIEKSEGDLAGTLPAMEFRIWCEAVPGRSDDLLACIDRKVPYADRFLPIALRTGAAADHARFLNRALDFAVNGNDIEQRGALTALSELPLEDDIEWDQLIASFVQVLDGNPDEDVRASLLTALAARLEDAPAAHREKLVALSKRVLEVRTDKTLGAAASALAFAKTPPPDDFVEVALDALSGISSVNAGTLDFAIMRMIERGQAERARIFLEGLLTRDDDAVELGAFDSVCYKLREVGGDVLDDWAVAWLLDGDERLCSALNEATFGSGIHGTILSPNFSRYGLSGADFPYLARKTIVTFLLNPELVVSILAALLRSAPSDAAKEIVDLLVDPVLIAYSGVAAERLKAIADDATDAASPSANAALEGLDAYLDGLRSIGNVPELHPSDREKQIEHQRHSDAMAEAFRQARKDSIFAIIATEMVMLYGTSSVSWLKDRKASLQRHEMGLTSFGQSFEVPRLDTIDPVGLQLMLIEFRRERRPS